MIRWKCPNCGSGINAPSRMRLDDSRRFCLDCSSKSPRLVSRVAPKLEAKRKRKKERSAAKLAEERKSRDALPWVRRDDLIQKEFKRLKRLKFWRDDVRHASLKIYRRTFGGGGRAYGWGLTYVTIGKNTSEARVRMVLLHELSHIACGTREGHGDKFRSKLIEAAFEAYRVKVSGAFGSVYGDLDNAVYRAIHDKLQGEA